MIIERNGREEVVRVTNIQNELHEKDPEQFPRTAAIAYTMGPESAPILIAAERGELAVRAFYHSHPEHDSYFSAEDKKQAMGGWDEPNYPQAAQIVDVGARPRGARHQGVRVGRDGARLRRSGAARHGQSEFSAHRLRPPTF